MSFTTTIQELPEDILIRVLGFCHVHCVILISQTNHYLHTIALVKQLWISIVEDLTVRSLLELPPGLLLTQHSTEELINHVKRAAIGPCAWRHPQSGTSSKRIVLPATVKASHGYQGDSKVKLVNGGRHVVLAHRTAVEIWDVETRRRLWSRPVFAVTFNVNQGDSHTNITLAMTLDDRFTLEIVQIDTNVGETQLFSLRLPAFNAHADPIICGNLLIVHMRVNAIGGYETLIVDWVNRKYVLLSDLRGSSVPCMGIVAGTYLVVVGDIEYKAGLPERSLLETRICLYSTTVFDPHWNLLSTLNSPAMKRIALAALVPVIVETPTFEGEPFHHASSILSVHESPLSPNTFRLRVYLSDGGTRSKNRETYIPAAVFCYRCNGGTNNNPGWRHESTRRAVSQMAFHAFSYAGYAVEDRRYDVHNSASANLGNRRVRSPLLRAPQGALWQHLSPYSAVVTTLMPEEVVVAYYD
ncbi:hypothetical protein DFH06DRAFT_1483368 [Mycena polygramma]|nr:hypothetical protein DFH06DRAFT_1483368 [Mycena polygramma]